MRFPSFKLHASPELGPVVSSHRHNLVAEMDPDNAGVLIVQLGEGKSGRGRSIGADEVTRRLERQDGCVIM